MVKESHEGTKTSYQDAKYKVEFRMEIWWYLEKSSQFFLADLRQAAGSLNLMD